VIGEGVVWYSGQFWALYFLQQVSKVDLFTSSYIVMAALLIAMPTLILWGWVSDHIGRKDWSPARSPSPALLTRPSPRGCLARQEPHHGARRAEVHRSRRGLAPHRPARYRSQRGAQRRGDQSCTQRLLHHARRPRRRARQAEREGSLREKIRFLCRFALLIVDEIGYLPVTPGGGNLFFQLALLNMSLANAYIVNWDAKYTYNFWRPVTAIRNGDQDGNDATERDAGWTSFNPTPSGRPTCVSLTFWSSLSTILSCMGLAFHFLRT
jgi:IstB-like ATP binding protein